MPGVPAARQVKVTVFPDTIGEQMPLAPPSSICTQLFAAANADPKLQATVKVWPAETVVVDKMGGEIIALVQGGVMVSVPRLFVPAVQKPAMTGSWHAGHACAAQATV